MLLPKELLLDVLAFADFGTLVAAKFAAARFLDVVTKFAAQLARGHSFQVLFCPAYLTYTDMTIGARRKSIRYERGTEPSLVAACRELAAVIGTHVVAKLMFLENTWNMPGVGFIFEAAPSLKYAEDSAASLSLRLGPNYDVLRQFNWTFLRQESARELRHISVDNSSPKEHWSQLTIDQLTEKVNRSVEELVRYCAALPPSPSGETLEVDFLATFVSGAFVLRIIELLKDARRQLTIRMRLQRYGGELALDERDYKVEVDDGTTRYASVKSGTIVELNGRSIAIQRAFLKDGGKVQPMVSSVEN